MKTKILFLMIISLFFYNCSVNEEERVKEEKENILTAVNFANNLKGVSVTPLSIKLINNLSNAYSDVNSVVKLDVGLKLANNLNSVNNNPKKSTLNKNQIKNNLNIDTGTLLNVACGLY